MFRWRAQELNVVTKTDRGCSTASRQPPADAKPLGHRYGIERRAQAIGETVATGTINPGPTDYGPWH